MLFLCFRKRKSRKNSLYFRKWNVFIFLKTEAPKKLFIFQETELFYTFLKKVFLIFQERYIQNPGICRTRSILRTLVYSEPEAYSEHRQASTMERFVKVAT